MQRLTELRQIADDYDAFLLDLWGVVHDGTQLYPGARGAMKALKQSGKKIMLVSNAPRRAHKAVAVLEQLGIHSAMYDHIITSGELGYRALAQFSPSPCKGEGRDGGQTPQADPHLNPPPFSGRNYFYIGPAKDADVLDGLDFTRVDDIAQADFLLNVGFGSEEEKASDLTGLLRAAKAGGLAMLCLNPDMEVVKITGERFECAGVIAADYARLGGAVSYFGKPYGAVYEYCLQTLAPVAKARVLAVGDGIATDIKGAVDFGLDALFITGGIFKKDESNIEAVCRAQGAVPRYVMRELHW